MRRELENINIKLLCKGCCRNVYPSAIILSMGEGRKAYALTYGEQAKMENLVDIFTLCLVEEYATVKQQADFFQEWTNSLGKRKKFKMRNIIRLLLSVR